MQTITLPDLDKDRVTGCDGSGAQFDLSIREFIEANPEEFSDGEFAYDFMFSLATRGTFNYPVSMADEPIKLVKGGA